MSTKNTLDTMADDITLVNAAVIKNLSSKVPLVEDIGLHIINSGGKRLRPILTMLAARICGYNGNEHIHLASVIEYIHTATLLHDDVVDDSDMRRGNPTANNKWNNASSVLVGDFLYSRAFEILINIGNVDIMRTLAHASNTIAEGEVKQLLHIKNPDTTEAEYFQIIHGKTAILFEAACRAGAELTNSKDTTIEALANYGYHLGMAFQLIDDVMDYASDASTMGKNHGDDLAEGKTTLPLIHALHHANDTERQLIRKSIRQGDLSQMDNIISIMKKHGSLNHVRQQAKSQSEKAIAALTFLPKTPYKDKLIALCEQALDRNH